MTLKVGELNRLNEEITKQEQTDLFNNKTAADLELVVELNRLKEKITTPKEIERFDTKNAKDLELLLHRRLDSCHAMAIGSLKHRDERCRSARIVQVLPIIEECIDKLCAVRQHQNLHSDDTTLNGQNCPPEAPYDCDGVCTPYPCVPING